MCLEILLLFVFLPYSHVEEESPEFGTEVVAAVLSSLKWAHSTKYA